MLHKLNKSNFLLEGGIYFHFVRSVNSLKSPVQAALSPKGTDKQHRTPAPLYSYPRKDLPGGISS